MLSSDWVSAWNVDPVNSYNCVCKSAIRYCLMSWKIAMKRANSCARWSYRCWWVCITYIPKRSIISNFSIPSYCRNRAAVPQSWRIIIIICHWMRWIPWLDRRICIVAGNFVRVSSAKRRCWLLEWENWRFDKSVYTVELIACTQQLWLTITSLSFVDISGSENTCIVSSCSSYIFIFLLNEAENFISFKICHVLNETELIDKLRKTQTIQLTVQSTMDFRLCSARRWIAFWWALLCDVSALVLSYSNFSSSNKSPWN